MNPQEETLKEAQNTAREEANKRAGRERARNLMTTVGAMTALASAASLPTHRGEWPVNCRIPGQKRSILDKTRQARKRQKQARRRQRGK